MTVQIIVDREHDFEGTFIRITLDLGFVTQELMVTEEEAAELLSALREFLDAHHERRMTREQ